MLTNDIYTNQNLSKKNGHIKFFETERYKQTNNQDFVFINMKKKEFVM